jgi:Domain of unknown function (DUF4266)
MQVSINIANKGKTVMTMCKRIIRVCLAVVFVGASLASCQPVREYQKNRINDSEMTLGNRKVEKEEINMEAYREGSSGANGGKTGGGCGCN